MRRARLAGPTAASHGPRERRGSRGSGGAALGGEARRAPATLHGPRPSHHPLARSPPRSPRPSLGPRLRVWPGARVGRRGPASPACPETRAGWAPAGLPPRSLGERVPGRRGPLPTSRGDSAQQPGVGLGQRRKAGAAGGDRGVGEEGMRQARLAPERTRAARDRARTGARGGWGAMAWSNPPRLFLAPALGDAKCQVPGVPAGPRRGRAGRRSLKGSETCFPRGDGPGAQEVPSPARWVSGLGRPRSAHPRSGHCLSGPSPTPVPRTGSRRRPEGQLVTATTPPA